MSLLAGGCGWFSDASEVLRDPEQQEIARREESREEKAAEKADAARQEAREAREWQATHEGRQARTPGQILADAAAAQDRQDAVEAAKRHVSECGCGECDERRYGGPPEPPGLNRYELRREQEKREAALTPEQRRLRELQSEITQLKGRLAGMGFDPL